VVRQDVRVAGLDARRARRPGDGQPVRQLRVHDCRRGRPERRGRRQRIRHAPTVRLRVPGRTGGRRGRVDSKRAERRRGCSRRRVTGINGGRQTRRPKMPHVVADSICDRVQLRNTPTQCPNRQQFVIKIKKYLHIRVHRLPKMDKIDFFSEPIHIHAVSAGGELLWDFLLVFLFL